MTYGRCVIAAGLVIACVAGAAPAAAAIPCSRSAIASDVHLSRFESITAIRCADLTGDGRRDVAWSKSGGGSGGDVQWGVVYERHGQRKVARFTGQTHYFNLRVRGRRRVLIDSPVYRAADPNCCPTGGTRTESATWNGRRFVKRLVALKDDAPASARTGARAAAAGLGIRVKRLDRDVQARGRSGARARSATLE